MIISNVPFEKWIAPGGFHLLLGVLGLSLAMLPRVPTALPVVQAVFLSLLAGYLNLMTTEPQLPALLLFAAGAFATYSRPRFALLWIFLLPVPVPAGECMRALFNPFGMNLTAVLCSFTSILPAAVGAGAGIAAHSAARGWQTSTCDTSKNPESKTP